MSVIGAVIAAINDPWNWQQFGALGALAVALVAGQVLVLRYVVMPERSRGDRLEAELGTLNGVTREKTIPALVAATTCVAETTALVRSLEAELAEARRLLKERRDP